MSLRTTFVLALAISSLALPPSPAGADDEVVTAGDPRHLEPAPGRSLLYLLNPEKKRLDLFLDRNPVGSLKASYLAVRADPGPRLIWGTPKPQRFDLEPGRTYVLIFQESWTLSKTADPAKSVARLGVRFTPPSAAQLADLHKRLAKGDFSWALQVLGEQLPARFANVHIAVKDGPFKTLAPDENGTLTIGATGLTFQKAKHSLWIPITEIRESGPGADPRQHRQPKPALWPRRGDVDPVLRVVFGPAEPPSVPIVVSFTLPDQDGPRARAAVSAAIVANESSEAARDQAALAAGSPVERAARLADALETKAEASLEPAWGTASESVLPEVTDSLLDLLSYFDLFKLPAGQGIMVGPITVTVGISFTPKFQPEKGRLLSRPPMAQEAAVLAGDPALAELPAALRELEAHLVSHPDDARALVLAARLGRIAELTRPLPHDASLLDWLRLETASRARVARLRGFLDKALELKPDDVSAHLAAARYASLPLLTVGVDQNALLPLSSEQAMRSAQRALELAPGDPAALAIVARLLVAAGKPDEAFAVLGQGGGADQPMERLLADLAAVPLPEKAVLAPKASERLTQLLAEKGWLDRHREVRVRSYLVPGAATNVIGFYHGKWPRSGFFDLGQKQLGEMSGHLLGQHLRWTPDGDLLATNSQANLPRKHGIALFLLEMSSLPSEVSVLLPDAKVADKRPGRRFCLLSVVTLRTFPPA